MREDGTPLNQNLLPGPDRASTLERGAGRQEAHGEQPDAAHLADEKQPAARGARSPLPVIFRHSKL
eukprot:scaffold103073_cov41-Tisochrysis_lutea.AAC.4